EPSGRGGVCHYTHQLAEHLAKAGADVTLITTEDYELRHLDRHFRIRALFNRSWPTRLRRRLSRLGARPDRASGSSGAPISSGGAATPDPAGAGSIRPRLRGLRIRLLHLRVLLGFLWRRPDVVHVQWPVDRSLDARFR